MDSGTEKKREWGTDTYSKFDNLDSDDSDEEEKTAMQFNLGESNVTIKEIDYVAGGLERQATRIKELVQREREIWQVIIRKLRVWAASSEGAPEGDGAIPCRPYALFVTCLFPDGKLLAKEISEPAEASPSPAAVLRLLFRVMLDPSSGKQRRPGKVVFVEDDMVGELYRSLGRVGIEASQLSESDGVDTMVTAYSNYLVKEDIARRAPTAERPGVLSGIGMTPALGGAVWDIAAEVATRVPWCTVHERQTFRLTIEKPATILDPKGREVTVKPGIVWVCILGKECEKRMGSSQGTWGIGIFFSRLDLEARLTPKGHKAFRDAGPGCCSHTGQTAKDLGHDLKRTKPRKFDIRTGMELQFADQDALRAHWPKVKRFARPITELEEGLKKERKYWMPCECSILFENPTILPFDDHDAAEQYDWKIAPTTGPLRSNRWPFSLELAQGEPGRLSAENCVWVERACRAALYVGDNPGCIRTNHEFEIDMDLKSTIGDDEEKAKLLFQPLYLEAEVAELIKRKEKEMKQVEEASEDVSKTVEAEPQVMAVDAVLTSTDTAAATSAEMGEEDEESDEKNNSRCTLC